MKNVGRFFFNIVLILGYFAVMMRWMLAVCDAIRLNFDRHPILCGLFIACQLIPPFVVLTMFGISVLRNIEFE